MRARTILAFLSLGLALSLVLLDLGAASPGGLSRVHGRDPRMLDTGGCELCHAPAGLVAGCIGCHAPVGEQLEAGTGFHGQLAAQERASCESCHAEHHGEDHELAGERAFTVAGYAARVSYDHRGLAFGLHGVHAQLDCVACHERADAELLPEGESRFLGLETRCASCHEDPHEGRMARGCEACHGQLGTFAELSAFVHPGEFPLSAGHAELACASCHEPGGGYAVEDLASASPPLARGCLDCHDSPHADPFLAGVATLLTLEIGTSCASCHAVEHASFSDSIADMRPELHAASGFELTEPHDAVACSACHREREAFAPTSGGSVALALRFPGRSASDCAACHADPHSAQFGAPVSCLECHEPNAFDPPRFGAAEHEQIGYRLDGAHAQVDCHACHEPASEAPDAARRFRGTPRDCAACHADVHGGWSRADVGASDCGACHRTAAFAQVSRAEFDHARWTGFALEAAHATADCERCHPRSPVPDALGRRFGRVADHFGQPVDACASCHADVHGGSFDRADVPADWRGATGCERCHVPGGFARVDRPAFEHALWTGFELDGAHAAADCESCHTAREVADVHGRRFGAVASIFGQPAGRCDTCHADPHGGRFERLEHPPATGAEEDCAHCHTTSSFRAVFDDFDHASWTGFTLDGAHAGASCVACHPPAVGADVGTLGAARGDDCASCHSDPHAGQFRAGEANDCARCHASTTSFTELHFDHARDARFALDEQHASLDCSACHRPWPLADGGQVVRYKPLGTECAECHLPGGDR